MEDSMSETSNTKDTTLAGTLTVAQLRTLFREEFKELIELNGNAAKKPENAARPYLMVKEAANLARIAESTIRLYIRQGKLRAEKVGRRVIIKRGDLERFLDAHPTGSRAELLT